MQWFDLNTPDSNTLPAAKTLVYFLRDEHKPLLYFRGPTQNIEYLKNRI